MFKVLCNGFALSRLHIVQTKTGSLRVGQRDFVNMPGSDALKGGVNANFFVMIASLLLTPHDRTGRTGQGICEGVLLVCILPFLCSCIGGYLRHSESFYDSEGEVLHFLKRRCGFPEFTTMLDRLSTVSVVLDRI
jgi:hypothetical protein